jgi:hypothetical protein
VEINLFPDFDFRKIIRGKLNREIEKRKTRNQRWPGQGIMKGGSRSKKKFLKNDG